MDFLGDCLRSKKQSSEDVSKLKQDKSETFNRLRTLSASEEYQGALKFMQESDHNTFHIFVTIIETLLNRESSGEGSVRVFLIITAQTYRAEQQILDLLNTQGSKVTPTQDLQQCDVILLFCPASTRVGSCVSSAVKKIPGGAEGKPVILILMHHTRDPDMVPNQTSWSKQFPIITQEVRVLYHDTQNGLLDCPLNQEAVGTLRSICGRYMKKNQEDGLTLDSTYENITEQEINEVRGDQEHQTDSCDDPAVIDPFWYLSFQ